MIVLNTVIVCIYYTDKKQYVMSVKKYVGYSKVMIFCDVFAGFLRWAVAGFMIGTLAVLTIIMTSLGKYIMFSALSLNVPTVIISLVMVSLTALVFTVISVFRIYRGDISRSIRE